jgi:type VI protein secretion system component VasK
VPKISTFLKGLVGRVREMLAQILFAFGGTCFPLGLYWEIEYPETPALWFTFIILGAIFWIGAVWAANKKEKEERLERERIRKLLVDVSKNLRTSNRNKQRGI